MARSDNPQYEILKLIQSSGDFSNFLDRLYDKINKRSLANIITNIGTQIQISNRFFPDQSGLYIDYPLSFLVMIPKQYANRYARLWTSLFPARVSFLKEKIKTLAKQANLLEEFNRAYTEIVRTNSKFSIDLSDFDQINLVLEKMLEILKSKGMEGSELYAYIQELKEEYLFGPIDKVLIESIRLQFPERSAVFISANSTIPYIQFWGSSVYSIDISMVLPDAINLNGKIMFLQQYVNRLRGTSLTSKYRALFVDFEDLILTIYPTGFGFGQSSGNSGHVSAGLSGYLTRILYSPFDPSKLNYSVPVDDISIYSRYDKNYEELYSPLVNKEQNKQKSGIKIQEWDLGPIDIKTPLENDNFA